ncbi:MAG: tetratricopeptide repeat protein [Bacteroidetes bacterium]|nr:tetratricopeptide repeat protein [Bacteroidota bacterium]
MKSVTILIFLFPILTLAQNVKVAKEYYRYNLTDKAKEEFILTFQSSKSSDNDKAESLYWLGQISFDENNYTVAFEDWNNLVEKYPNSEQAVIIQDRLSQLKDIIEEVSITSISSVVARSYIKHGDFWSEASRRFTIDSSWMPNVELAIEWYNRVIEEFSGSSAAEIAFKRKISTILGWKESGRYGSAYGVKGDFNKYMPMVLSAFDDFSNAFPESSYLQGFRYQIAQAYWSEKKWSETRDWLNKIINASDGEETFYTQTAKARLKKVEY